MPSLLAGAATSAAALILVAALRWTRLGCFAGMHRAEPDWRDTGEEPDEGGRIYAARNCVRCGRELERLPLSRQWSYGGSTLYGPPR